MRTVGRTFILLFILISSSSITGIGFREARAANGNPVHNINTGIDYPTIQAAIDARETLNGNTINIDPGTYIENVVISKSISLVGTNPNTTIVDGGGNITAVVRIAANDVTVRGLTVRNATTGILVDNVNNTLVVENNAVESLDLGQSFRDSGIELAIRVRYSGNCTLDSNLIANNGYSGILFTNSWNFTARNNFAYNNSGGYAMNANDSSNGFFIQNVILSSSFDGIGLGEGSTRCVVTENSIQNGSLYGLWVDTDSQNNTVYRNNFINNRFQAIVTNTIVQWDNGIEGNYWSNYAGVDLNNDGIGDAPYIIRSPDNADPFPLMGPFYTYTPYKGYRVNVSSNSTIEDFVFFKANSTIRMRVSDSTVNQSHGFCRMRIPYALMTQPYTVTVDGDAPENSNFSIYGDSTNRWIYFSYSHSLHEVIIQGTFSPDVDAPIINLLSPEDRMYKTDTIELNFTVDEETSWIGYSLDGQANVTIQGNSTLSGLSSIAHNITVFANDSVGNMGSSPTAVFTIGSPQLSIWIILGGIIVAAAVVITAVAIYIRRRKVWNAD